MEACEAPRAGGMVAEKDRVGATTTRRGGGQRRRGEGDVAETDEEDGMGFWMRGAGLLLYIYIDVYIRWSCGRGDEPIFQVLKYGGWKG